MKLFRKKYTTLYCVVGFRYKQKVGEYIDHQPVILGLYKNIKKAEKHKESLESGMWKEYSQVIIQRIPSDL